MAEPMMAPAAIPPITPAATRLRHHHHSCDSGHQLKTATPRPPGRPRRARMRFVSWDPSGRNMFGRDHAPRSVTRTLRTRADEARLAPADEIAPAVVEPAAGPIAVVAIRRIRVAVALVDDIARGRRVIARLAVGDGAADDGAGGDAADDTGGNSTTTVTAAGLRPPSARSTSLQRSWRPPRWREWPSSLVFPPGSQSVQGRRRNSNFRRFRFRSSRRQAQFVRNLAPAPSTLVSRKSPARRSKTGLFRLEFERTSGLRQSQTRTRRRRQP